MASSADRPYDESIQRATAASPPSEATEQRKAEAEVLQAKWVESPGKLVQALIFGAIFGFLLQKGGVAKFDILIGVLLLEDFTVVKIMLTAIVVGMIGVYALRRLGLVELQIKETVYGADVVGGLIFGVGFALLAYCPGTNAAAMGQGNWDALVGAVGLLAGSYLFALSSKFGGGGVAEWGKRGKITLPDVLGLSPGLTVAIFAPLLVGVLLVLQFVVSR